MDVLTLEMNPSILKWNFLSWLDVLFGWYRRRLDTL